MARLPHFRCSCGIDLWDNHVVGDPGPGTVVICIYCAQLIMLDEQMVPQPIVISDLPLERRAEIVGYQKQARREAPVWLALLKLQRKRGN